MHLNVGATSHKIEEEEEEEEDFVLRTILANHCLNVALFDDVTACARSLSQRRVF